MANLMWSFGVFQMGASLLIVVFLLVGVLNTIADGQGFDSDDAEVIAGWGTAAGIGIGASAVVIRGADAMRRRRRYQLAVTAAAIMGVSVPCVVALPYAAPLALWTVLVLCRGDVRNGFYGLPTPIDTGRRPHEDGQG
jgi:hypothetical protein